MPRSSAPIKDVSFFCYDRDRACSTLLLSICFAVAFSGLNSLVASGLLIALFELVFIVAFLLIYRAMPSLRGFRQSNPLAFSLFIVWSVLSLLSLAQLFIVKDVSPMQQQMALARFIAIWLHIGFCFSVASYLGLSRFNGCRYYMVVCLSVVVMAAIYLLTYSGQNVADAHMWFETPPLAVHIRHIGGVAMVASVISLAYMLLLDYRARLSFSAWGLLALISFSFLCWMGGRTSVVAVLICVVLLLCYRLWLRRLSWVNVVLVLCTVTASVVIAESVSVFDWNGFARMLATANKVSVASLEAEGGMSLNAFTTGRASIWHVSIEALKQSPWLGLGPNGYLFIADRPYGVQPHSMFVQFAVEWGVLGALVLVLLLIVAVYHGLKRFYVDRFIAGVDDAYIVAGLVVLVLSLQGLTGGTYFHSQPLFYLVLAFALFPFNAPLKLTSKL